MRKILVAGIASTALVLAACGSGANAVVQAGESCLAPSETSDANDENVFEDVLTINDDHVVVESRGNDDGFEFDIVGYGAALCVLKALDAPDYITEQMESTRSLDGRQSTSWDGYTAEWTYHPDDGLDVLFYLTEEA